MFLNLLRQLQEVRKLNEGESVYFYTNFIQLIINPPKDVISVYLNVGDTKSIEPLLREIFDLKV